MTDTNNDTNKRDTHNAMIGTFIGAILGIMLVAGVLIAGGNLRDKDAKEMAYQRLIDAKENPENPISDNLSAVSKKALQDGEITTKEYSEISDVHKLFIEQRDKQLLAD